MARSRSSRMSSTPPCDAASSSITSRLPGPPGASDTQDSHTPHGVDVGPWLVANEITIVSTVPTLVALWPPSSLERVRLLIMGGEACPPELASRLQVSRTGVREAIRTMLSSDGVVRAFGHRLYPDGDPRAKAIMSSFDVPPLYAALAEAGEELLGEPANLDFSLAALAAAYALPDDAPMVIFALARTVGWLAHAMEQVVSGDLIRPRAHYAGS